MTLYELSNDIRQIMADIGDDGEITDEQIEAIDRLSEDFDEKAETICKIIVELKNDASSAKDEAERLSKLAKSRENAADRLKAYLKRCLEESGQSRVETDLFKVRIQKNSVPTVTVDCLPEHLPEAFQRVKIESDREAIMKQFKAGEPLPESVKVEYGTHLRIT